MPRFESIQQVIDSLEENFKPEAAEGIDAIFQLNYAGEGGGDWALTVKDSALTVDEGVVEDPTVTVTCEAENWLKIANGDLNPMMAMATGKLKISGPLPLAIKFGKIFGLG